MTSLRTHAAVLFSVIGFGCAPVAVSRPAAKADPASAAVIVEKPATPPDGIEPRLALVLRPNRESWGELANFLEAHPDLKITLIPHALFHAEVSSTVVQRFRVMQSSQQVESVLSLEHEPILPLLADLRLAGEKVGQWNFEFKWPDDVAAHLARDMGRHQRQWGKTPSGFLPPYGALSPDVLEMGRRFRLKWALVNPMSAWGVRNHDGFFVLAPPALPDTSGMVPGSREWQERLALWTLSHPFVVIDATTWQPQHQMAYLEQLVRVAEDKRPGLLFVNVEEILPGASEHYSLPPTVSPFEFNYSSWIATPQQRRAWQALSEARSVLDSYKNSGRAQLNRLDAAMEEMTSAESGMFLLSLAQPRSTDLTGERTFLATLANIYRLTNTAIPAQLNSWFAYRGGARTTKPSMEGENDRPFFVEGPQSHTWNDPKNDVQGPGKPLYPIGAYPKGAFDLREFTVSWTDKDVTFSIGLVDLPGFQSVAVAPLTDIYVDVNRLPDAGGTEPLPERGRAMIAREAAWEYAISLSFNQANLWQSLPGGEARRIQSRPVHRSGNSLSVSFPRLALRGSPSQWRMTVIVMGTENSRKNDSLLPIPILAQPGERNFGGASGPRSPLSAIDVLAPTGEIQDDAFQTIQRRGRGDLPYAESPAP